MAAQEQLDEKSINTIRFLAVDAVEQAQSGHPGTPMGAAAMAYTLWDRFLIHNPKNPAWPDRDRFILSPGHASMLLYVLLHLTGCDLPLEELKNFRQWGSKTPGHPEYHETPGVEMTTGPLGQGFAHAVGMAIAERWLAEHYNRPGHEIIDHVTYALVSDGDMQEGVSSEAASIAGTLRLGKLIFLYDANDIQIEGSTGIAFSENVAQRFAAYGRQVIGPIDGHSVEDVATAIAGGMALHGGVIPYTATFLTFSDYIRPPMRFAALMGLRVIYIFTHDSIGLGEDGPTHQPVEHLMNLRAVPNLTMIRPADATETAEAWRAALRNRRGPTALIFSRQTLPLLDQTELGSAAGVRRGAYVLWESGEGLPEVILIGTGSEVHVALEAGRQLDAEGIQARVVSMPSWELFDRQPADYRESALPAAVRARVAVEAGQRTGWEHYTGLDGAIVGLDGFGASAPAGVLYEEFGITADAVAAEARTLLQRNLAPAAEAALAPAPRG